MEPLKGKTRGEDLYELVSTGIEKMKLPWNKVFTHFATLATQKETIQNVKKYSKSLGDLHAEFCRRFSDVEKIDQSLQLVACPLSQNPETAPEEVQLELIDLQSDFVLMEKFSSLELRDFYASLNEATFPNIRRMAQKILVLFGSTYICEQTFSVMNINKAPHRPSLTDEHLRSILRMATTKLTPDFDALAKKKTNNTVPTEVDVLKTKNLSTQSTLPSTSTSRA
uniref:HAT C-terminal dimerisation domain-containing protein n=1 Tax=Myotis myotis TaxID=51298 RepID=A0A7J7R4M9_MYOMY|nr:hypothetical protein mMyoMyo1_010902 [Myotis myotis]